MYCSSCAAVLEPNQTACPRCGRPIEAAPAPRVAPVQPVDHARPPSVRLAVILLLISLAATPLSVIMIFARSPSGLGAVSLPASFLIQTLFFLALWIVVIAFLWQRQNWARIAIVVLTVWMIVNLALSLLRISGSTAVIASFMIPVATLALRLAALFLLFKPESTAWFSSRG